MSDTERVDRATLQRLEAERTRRRDEPKGRTGRKQRKGNFDIDAAYARAAEEDAELRRLRVTPNGGLYFKTNGPSASESRCVR